MRKGKGECFDDEKSRCDEETVEDITGAILRDYAPAFQALCERLARLEEEAG